MSTLEIKSLYDAATYDSFLQRIEQLTPESTPIWGKMTTAQMLAHCSEIQEVCNGKVLGKTPLLFKLIKGMIKRAVINDQPYRKNSPTHPQYLIKEDRDFEVEKTRLLSALAIFKADEEKNISHPFFGDLSADERGWAMYKHHNHHLEQFGV